MQREKRAQAKSLRLGACYYPETGRGRFGMMIFAGCGE